jgi:glycosyltransferase involved in cell wall biosynthesis
VRILVLCYEYPPIGGGGGRAAKDVAEELARRGHEVRVQTAGMRDLPRFETINGVDVFRSESFRRDRSQCSVPEMALFLITSFVPTLRLISKWAPHVIHAHFAVPTGALAWAARLLTGTPYVLTVQLGDVPGGVPDQTDILFRFLKPFTIPIWRQASAITVVSEFVKDLAMRSYNLPVVKVPNGIRLNNRPPKPLPCNEPPHLIAIGRFNPQKNFLFMIDVLAQVRDLRWKLTLIGDGALMAEIQQRIADHKLTDRVKQPGWLDSREVQQVLASGDIFLMPSLAEGLPIAGLEALKYGLAIVASDVGGLHDVVEQNINGFLLPVNNANAFELKVRELLKNPDAVVEMKRASYQKATEFDLVKIAERYEAVLRSDARPV